MGQIKLPLILLSYIGLWSHLYECIWTEALYGKHLMGDPIHDSGSSRYENYPWISPIAAIACGRPSSSINFQIYEKYVSIFHVQLLV